MSRSASLPATFNPADFVHLHVHSHYSLLDGLTKVPALLDQTKKFGMQAVALTDHGTLSGAIEFYQGCQERQLKPIIGLEAYLAQTNHTDRSEAGRPFTHLILLAQNEAGYKNLMQLATIAFLDGFYYKPRIDKALLEQYKDGLIVLSGCLGSEISTAVRRDDMQTATDIASWYQAVFGDNFYLELQDHAHVNEEQKIINERLLVLADKLHIEPVVTADSHYLLPGDQEAHEVLLCIQTRRFFDDDNRMSLKGWNLEFTDPADIVKRWQTVCPQALWNTKKIADKCNLVIDFDRILLPSLPRAKQQSAKAQLHKLVFQGLAVRYGNCSATAAGKLTMTQIKKQLPAAVTQRAEYELGVIDKMNFADYFLIVWDFCHWGKQQNIFFGPGRGSAAGSIVAYSLDITTVDPIKYDLLFERFLNPERVSLPDIDIDIEDSRRDEVIEYVRNQYGADRVANIVTFGTMAARNAVRDVARVLKLSYAHADQLAKLLPPPLFGRNVALKDGLEASSVLKAKYASDPQIKKIFDLALQLEDTIRNHGVHAAGVVIAPDALVNFTPLEVTAKGVVTTQYSMQPIEALGLLKMDFLGLSNLTTIKNAGRIIRKVYQQELTIDQLDFDDDATYKLLSDADTTGVFQLESRGMRQYLKRLKPSRFEDIAAILALYRPGPLNAGVVDQFIERRHGRQTQTDLHPALQASLEKTYGILVYQEQIMQISRDVCGFSGMEADALRKAIGKKERKTMAKMQQLFIQGGIKKSQIPQADMDKLWQDIAGFADYAFNRSHSVAYGLITYQTAYLKTHFRSAFMASVMTTDAGNTNRLKTAVVECNAYGIKVLPPDVNESFLEFAVVPIDNATHYPIRFGLGAIKHVSRQAAEQLVELRGQTGGPFTSLADFIDRQRDNRYLTRPTIEALIKAGAFDCLAPREQLLEAANLEAFVQALTWTDPNWNTDQASLLADQPEDVSDFSLRQATLSVTPFAKLDWERELLGIYLSQHPLDFCQQACRNQEFTNLADLADLTDFPSNQRFQIAGVIINLTDKIAKVSRKQMALIDFEDKSGSREFILSPFIFEKYKSCWQEGSVLKLNLRLETVDATGTQLPSKNLIIEQVAQLTPDA